MRIAQGSRMSGMTEDDVTMNELLKIDNLIVAFRDRRTDSGPVQSGGGDGIVAVRGVDLEIGRGETLALAGESGCGKTVLCKSMLGFLCERGAVEGGSIEYMGSDLVGLEEKELVGYRGGQIAMIPQDPMTSLDPMVSVGEQIAEAVRLSGRAGRSGDGSKSQTPLASRIGSRQSAKEVALDLMSRVGIEDAENRYDQRPYQFSGGMRQRIVIAIALAGNPKLILADEPTTALDEQTQQEVLGLIKDLQKEVGFGMLFITHDLHLVADMADRVAIMKDGRIVEEGPVDRVFDEPEHEYTRQLLGYLDYYRHRGHTHKAAGEDVWPEEVSGSTGMSSICERTEETRPDHAVVLTVDRLNKSYGELEVLKNFSLKAYRGEILGIIGRSGCGKSTLAGCIMGIEPFESGSIEIAGGRKKAQMIFQGTQDAFNGRMTIGDIIAEPLRIQKRRRSRDGSAGHDKSTLGIEERVSRVMDEVGLDRNLAVRRSHELSGGQRQRAAIARALIAEPDIIIADEPLTGLDVTAQAKIVHLLRKLVDERNLSLILIAHDRPMVEHVSDRIIQFD